jgi:hypothetical protein
VQHQVFLPQPGREEAPQDFIENLQEQPSIPVRPGRKTAEVLTESITLLSGRLTEDNVPIEIVRETAPSPEPAMPLGGATNDVPEVPEEDRTIVSKSATEDDGVAWE